MDDAGASGLGVLHRNLGRVLNDNTPRKPHSESQRAGSDHGGPPCQGRGFIALRAFLGGSLEYECYRKKKQRKRQFRSNDDLVEITTGLDKIHREMKPMDIAKPLTENH